MFQTFNVPAFFLGNQATLALMSVGKNTGLVLDIGDDVTYAVPVYDNYPLKFV